MKDDTKSPLSDYVRLCGGGRCPRVFLAENGDFIVQGLTIDPGLKKELDPLPNEDVVRLPKEVVDELFRNYQR